MRYSISMRDNTESVQVKDMDGVSKYHVRNNNEVPTGYHISIYNEDEVDILQVSKKAFTSKYLISDGDKPVAIVSGKTSEDGPKASIARATGIYQIRGNFEEYLYYIIKDSETIARVSRGNRIEKDEYFLDIFSDGEDDFLISVAVILDGITYSHNKSQQEEQ